jgi:hypothetical protein
MHPAIVRPSRIFGFIMGLWVVSCLELVVCEGAAAQSLGSPESDQ